MNFQLRNQSKSNIWTQQIQAPKISLTLTKEKTFGIWVKKRLT
jgi:hypothetical protein